MPLRVRVRAPLRATEDPAKVEQAVRNLFPAAELALGAGEVRGEGGDLARLAELVRNHQIPDSARGAMLRGLRTTRGGAETRFELGKQAAAMGRPHFGPPPSPLGNVEVTIEADSEEEILRAVYACAPDTTVEPEWATVPRELRPTE